MPEGQERIGDECVMPQYIQKAGKDPIFILECECCGFDIREKAEMGFKKVVSLWPGVSGNFNGKWAFICEKCLTEAKTGEHEVFWRW